jgi:hypothetical protein
MICSNNPAILKQTIVNTFIEGTNFDGFQQAITEFIKITDTYKIDLKNLTYNNESLIAYALNQNKLTTVQTAIYKLYFFCLGDQIIETEKEKDYLLAASQKENTDLIQVIFYAYDELAKSVLYKDNGLPIKERISAAKKHNKTLLQYFKSPQGNTLIQKPVLIVPITVIKPPEPFVMPSPLNDSSDFSSNLKTEEDKEEDLKLDPLHFEQDTRIGMGIGCIFALTIITLAYTLSDDTLRDGFYNMFQHMHDDFHHTHGDPTGHINVKLGARVGFFCVLTAGAAAVGGLLCGPVRRKLGGW